MNTPTKFPVRGVHQIEMTSICNLRCPYCAYPKMKRAKEHMSDETYRKTLDVCSRLLRLHGARPWGGRRPELNLAGIGESTLHPNFVRNVHWAREAVGWGVDLILATNGIRMDDELARAIAGAKPRVWVSTHRPEKAGPAIEALRRVGLYNGASDDAAQSSVDWAGQVQWHVSTPAKGRPCDWIAPGLVFVLSDGRIARCCFDATADDVLGTVDDDVSVMTTSRYKLCDACHLVAPN